MKLEWRLPGDQELELKYYVGKSKNGKYCLIMYDENEVTTLLLALVLEVH